MKLSEIKNLVSLLSEYLGTSAPKVQLVDDWDNAAYSSSLDKIYIGLTCKDVPLEQLIAHEVRHAYQVKTGLIEAALDRYFWKGRFIIRINMIDTLTLEEYEALPWEKDANDWMKSGANIIEKHRKELKQTA